MNSDRAPTVSPGPATAFFAARFRELLGTHGILDEESGRVKEANPYSVSKILAEAKARGVTGLSQTQIYRLAAGEASPTLVVVYEIARVFGVSPHTLVLDGESDATTASPDP